MTPDRGDDTRCSIVILVFNEDAVVPILPRRLDVRIEGLDRPAEAICVDDGSTGTASIVPAAGAKDDSRCLAIGPTATLARAPTWDRASARLQRVPDPDEAGGFAICRVPS